MSSKSDDYVKIFNWYVVDVIFSGIGAAFWTVIIVTWVVMFQVNRARWGEFADSISFIIPQGMP